MTLLTSLHLALDGLGRNALRTTLAMLGLIIGVAAVIVVVAVGRGAQARVEHDVGSAGPNLVFVSAGNFTRNGETVNILSGRGSATTLTADDAAEIARLAGVRQVAPGVSDRLFVSAGSRRHFAKLDGTTPGFATMWNWDWRYGRMFGAADLDLRGAVAVLGEVASVKLFGEGVDPVGKTVQIKGRTFTVVGVLTSSDEDHNDQVFLPWTTLQQMQGVACLATLLIEAERAGDTNRIAEDTTRILRRRHHLDDTQAAASTAAASGLGGLQMPGSPGSAAGGGVPDDFVVKTQAAKALTQGLYTTAAAFVLANLPQLDKVTMEEMAGTLQQASLTMTALLSSIAAVSLVVGGIGIMNIMLIAVTERTAEIGLRRTVGARAHDVLLHFLLEAVALSLMGGTIGALIGVGGAVVVTVLMQMPTSISGWSIVTAFGISAAIGVFFGYYPARKASRLSPIDALRFE